MKIKQMTFRGIVPRNDEQWREIVKKAPVVDNNDDISDAMGFEAQDYTVKSHSWATFCWDLVSFLWEKQDGDGPITQKTIDIIKGVMKGERQCPMAEKCKRYQKSVAGLKNKYKDDFFLDQLLPKKAKK